MPPITSVGDRPELCAVPLADCTVSVRNDGSRPVRYVEASAVVASAICSATDASGAVTRIKITDVLGTTLVSTWSCCCWSGVSPS